VDLGKLFTPLCLSHQQYNLLQVNKLISLAGKVSVNRPAFIDLSHCIACSIQAGVKITFYAQIKENRQNTNKN